MDSYKTVLNPGFFEFEQKKSRFLGYAFPVSSESEALKHLSEVKAMHPSSRHVVYAYVIRQDNRERYTDDGEPQGTAGIPCLDVIKKANLTDVAVFVVRYFGGTLLGTGGLVRAYTAAATGAMQDAKIIKRFLAKVYDVNADYGLSGKLEYFFKTEGFEILETQFSEDVKMRVICPKGQEGKLLSEIADISGGKAKVSFLEEKYFDLAEE